MKIRIALMVLFMAMGTFAQQAGKELRTQVFSLTPFSKKTGTVNGMAFGLGHVGHIIDDRKTPVVINGFNLEANPLTPLIILFLEPGKVVKDEVLVTQNGLHISTAGFMGAVRQNGLSIAAYNITHTSNGVAVTALYNAAKALNGLQIAGISNSAERAVGLLIAPANKADSFTGLQLGLYNKAGNLTGIQIGLFNQTARTRGLQVGLWNSNGRRSLPFINF